MNAKYEFIDAERANFPVSKMCAWAGVSRSGYYEWRDRGPSATDRRRERLHSLVRFAFEHSDSRAMMTLTMANSR